MYFTDTPELRKFERQMKQKPNFDSVTITLLIMKVVIKEKTSNLMTTKNLITEVRHMKTKIRSPT